MEIAWIDCETTGLSVSEDRIIQIGIVIGDKSYCWLINPQMQISIGAYNTHHISNSDVHFKPTFEEVADNIYNLLSGRTIGGYNLLSFDIPILIEEFKRIGVKFRPGKIIDVFNIWKSLEDNKLTTAYYRFTGEKLINSHDAIADVTATKKVYESMCQLYKDVSLDELSYTSTSIKNGCLTFGKHKGKELKDIDKQYLIWLYHNTTDVILKREIKNISVD